MVETYIGLGSNIGDRLENIARAVDLVADMDGIRVEAVSTAYLSEPWGNPDQPNFANAVAAIETSLEPEQLLDILKEIELQMGRVAGEPNAPRIIDLDILLMEDTELSTPDLVIPHPRMAERDFVITPLLELNPEVTWPDGSAIAREGATEGKVLGELGCVRDWGEEHNEPIYAEHWVVIAEGEMAQNIAAGFDPSLILKREILEEAGIPFAWDPYEPGTAADPWGMYTIFRMLVPQQDAPRARKLIDEAMAAEPIFPDESEVGSVEDADS
ncbi:MAG: 2-amino-4-hydroxy-6-hydroxymethyldihydropteridine diphosphokinase [Coriobacteriales bacterium]|nr:2-amino-4-hydroxy-6-hydroxymethyldihydropteridine diphosphokinase [Coriobacteriales bacterium]